MHIHPTNSRYNGKKNAPFLQASLSTLNCQHWRKFYNRHCQHRHKKRRLQLLSGAEFRHDFHVACDALRPKARRVRPFLRRARAPLGARATGRCVPVSAGRPSPRGSDYGLSSPHTPSSGEKWTPRPEALGSAQRVPTKVERMGCRGRVLKPRKARPSAPLPIGGHPAGVGSRTARTRRARAGEPHLASRPWSRTRAPRRLAPPVRLAGDVGAIVACAGQRVSHGG